MPVTDVSRPLRRDAERNRRRIIEAAREVFAVRGFTATLDDVAHHAGVGVGTVYRRFPTKEELVAAVFEGGLDDLVSYAEDALTAPTGWAGLTAFLRRSADLHAADRGMRDVVLGSGFGTEALARAKARIVPLLTRLIERAHAEGALRTDAAVTDLPMVMMMVSELAHHSSPVQPELYRRYLELFIDGLRAVPGTGTLGEPPTRETVDEMARRWVPDLQPRRPAGP